MPLLLLLLLLRTFASPTEAEAAAAAVAAKAAPSECALEFAQDAAAHKQSDGRAKWNGNANANAKAKGRRMLCCHFTSSARSMQTPSCMHLQMSSSVTIFTPPSIFASRSKPKKTGESA